MCGPSADGLSKVGDVVGMEKKYTIHLSPQERAECERLVLEMPFHSSLHRYARVLLFLDHSLPGALSLKATEKLCEMAHTDMYKRVRLYFSKGFNAALYD